MNEKSKLNRNKKEKGLDRMPKRREAILEAISFAAEKFLGTEPWYDSIPEILERLGQAAEVGRVYIFKNKPPRGKEPFSHQLYEWKAHEIAPQGDRRCNQSILLQVGQMPRWSESMSQGLPIQGLAKDFPEAEKEILLSQGIKSIVAVPILVEEHWWGFIGFHDCTAERVWSTAEIDTLKTAAKLIGAAIHRESSQNKLRESERRYKELADLLPQPVFETDLDGNLTFVNRSALEHFCYTREDFQKGMNAVDMFWPSNQEQIRAEMVKRLSGEATTNIDYYALRKDGSTFPVLVETAPLYRSGHLAGLRGVLIDITERKQMEEMLRKNEQLYRMIFNHSPLGIMHFDQDGAIVDCNDKFLEILGAKRETVIGFNMLESVRNEELKKVVQTSMTGETGHFEGPYVSITGNRAAFIRTIFSPITSEMGEFLCGLCVAEDITERRNAEQALKHSEARFRAIVEDQTELISRFAPDGTLNFVNDAYCRYFGETVQDLIGNKFWHHVPSADQERFRKHLANLNSENQVATIEHRVYTSTGEVRWQQWTDRAILDELSKVIEIQAVGRDITERRKVEEALRESEKQMRYLSSQILRAQEQERQRIARDLHDSIIQLLATIKINLRASVRHLNHNRGGKNRESFESIISMVQDTIEEVRRVYTGLRPSMLDNLGILATLSWACQEFQETYEAIHVEREVDVKEEEIPDTLKIVIYRILQEALNNIAKHSQADFARVSLKKYDSAIELVFQDNGCGFDIGDIISQKNRKRGLGLVSMKERTELAGGIFDIESAKQRGTIIRCTWPTTRAHYPASRHTPKPPKPGGQSYTQ